MVASIAQPMTDGESTIGRGARGRHVAALLGIVLLPLPLRVLVASAAGLAPDEAYYWSWSLEPAAGYLDHPPAVAWLIRLGTAVAGHGVLGVRLPALALGGVALPLSSYWLGRELGVAPRLALLLPLASALQPLGVAAGLLITPDVPLLLSWTLACAFVLRAARTGALLPWAAAGLATGLAILSKHTGWILLAAIGVGLLADPETRARLRTAGPWAALALALLVASPNLLWELGNDGRSLGFQLAHGLAPADPLLAPVRLLELVAGQVGLLTPVVAWGAWRFLRRGRAPGPRGRLPWVVAVAPLFVHGIASLLTHQEANWPAPAHPLLLAGAVAWLGEGLRAAGGETSRRRLRRLAAIAAATSAAVTVAAAVHVVRPLPWPPAAEEPGARLRAWHDLPPWIDGSAPLVADGYELAAALGYHAPGRPGAADGRATGTPREGATVVTAAPGDSAPGLPEWAGGGSPLSPLGTHAMRRGDGEVVRTLAGWRIMPREP